MSKRLYMVADPNGAGKTTTALKVLPNLKLYEFLNADEIAKGLAPLNPSSVPVTASKLLIQRFRDLLCRQKSFAFETTASGKNYVKYLTVAKENNYEIHLLFLWLQSSELACKRVAERVKQGGHDIPKETIENRYFLGLKNLFESYLELSDYVLILDNSLDRQKVIARKDINSSLNIIDKQRWQKMQELANGER